MQETNTRLSSTQLILRFEKGNQMFWNKKRDDDTNIDIKEQEEELRRLSNEEIEKEEISMKEDGSAVVNFPVSSQTANQLDELIPRISSNDADTTPNINAMDIVDNFLFNSADEVREDIAREIENNEGTEEEFDITGGELGEIDIRVALLSDIVLHYYLNRYHSWLEALFVAMDEVPALCLCVPGSPVEYSDTEDADIAAQELGYDSYVEMANTCDLKFKASPFLRKFAESTLEFAKNNWYEDVSKVSPTTYALAVLSELRGNWPSLRSSVEAFYRDSLPAAGIIDGKAKSPEGEDMALTGVIDISNNLMPTSFASVTIPDWEDLFEDFKSYNETKLSTLKTQDESDESDEKLPSVDEDVLALVYLQGYAWANRSWNKTDELMEGYINDCFAFCWACMSEDYRLIDPEQLEDHSKELDVLAEQLSDENGQIRLNQEKPGDPNDLSLLDEPSRRFIQLATEQQDAARLSVVQNALVRVIGVMSGTEQTVTDMFLDEILSCVYGMSDLLSQHNQIKCLEKIHNQTLEQVKKAAKTNKSRWKKYLSANEFASVAIKEKRNISDIDDDGNPVFADVPNNASEAFGANTETADTKAD